LDRNQIVVGLYDIFNNDDDSSDEEDDTDTNIRLSHPPSSKHIIEIDIDLSLSAYANVSVLFRNKKKTESKEIKTIEQSKRAIAAIENHAQKLVDKNSHNSGKLKSVRKVQWFEKFNW
jgi:hypothetical protein